MKYGKVEIRNYLGTLPGSHGLCLLEVRTLILKLHNSYLASVGGIWEGFISLPVNRVAGASHSASVNTGTFTLTVPLLLSDKVQQVLTSAVSGLASASSRSYTHVCTAGAP